MIGEVFAPKIIPKQIKEHFESLMDAAQVGFYSRFSCNNHINYLRIISENVEFRSLLYLYFIDF